MRTENGIVLIGWKHCGKSAVGKILARRLGFSFVDTDALIETQTGQTARALFLAGGAERMAEAEAEACAEALRGNTGAAGLVIATGGAFCENPAAVGTLRGEGIFCFLTADIAVLYRRNCKSAEEAGEMPAFLRGENPEARFRELYETRGEKYREIADITVRSTEETDPEQTAEAVLCKLRTEGYLPAGI